LPTLPIARRVVEAFLSSIAPDACAACDRRVPIMTIFCRTCAATLVPAESRGSGDIAPFVYGGALATAIGSFKYDRRIDRGRPLANLLLGALAPLRATPPTLVVPVPLHADRAAARGFNQAALLAKPVAQALGARFSAVLVRERDTEAQATLDRELRLKNVRGAFAARRRVPGERVLLVDDVRTTGATLEACAAVLMRAGARDVRTLVLASA
jgi:ComF family protein